MILQTKDITKRFDGLLALDQISLGIEQGEIFELIGPNGAGKSTLLNVIASVHKPNEGSVKFRGKEITGFSPEKVCLKGVARTFQIPYRFAKMSALENVIVSATFGSAKRNKNQVDCVIESP